MHPTHDTGGRRWERLPKGPLALLLLALACAPPDPAPRDRTSAPRAEPVTEFVNAHWLVADTFAYGSRSVAGGRFVPPTSAPPASRIDLRGAWVVPAFGDAHTHNLDGDTATISAYRREGVAYVQVLTNTPGGRERVAPALEGPGTLDAVYANGGITSTYGHPMLAYEPRAMGIGWEEFRERREEVCESRLMEEKAYWFVDGTEDLDRQWGSILAMRPDLLKIFLLEADQHPDEPECRQLGSTGLAPAIAGDVVRRAHEAGLRVWAHVSTAADFALAVDMGVDGIAHLPGYVFRVIDPEERREDYLIDDATARRAAASGVVVTPTVSLISVYAPDDSVKVAEARSILRENLARLIEHGVPIAVGSDSYGRTAWAEVEALAATGLWSPHELMLAWSRTTPRAIFPDRRIGELEPGAEATFVGLACDPRERLQCLREIEARVTDGIVLDDPPAPRKP